MSEGVPVSATDELRERLVRAVLRPHPKVELRPGEWVTDVGPVVDELAEVVAAVVAEARTEGAIAELEAAAQRIDHPTSYVQSAARRNIAWEIRQRLAALRGVGNQKAEPTKRRLRSGFPDYWCHICDAGAEGCEHPLPADQKGTEQ